MRIENSATVPFVGWCRLTVDRQLPFPVGRVSDHLFVGGRKVGVNTQVVDVKVALQPGQRVDIDLSTAVAAEPYPVQAPSFEHFGGVPMLAGMPMGLVDLKIDGAAYTAQFRLRIGAMLCAELWLRFYPDAPSWCVGELRVTASNGGVSDLDAVVPSDFRLTFGDALVGTIGQLFNQPLIAAGTHFKDGQSRALPLLFVWQRHLKPGDFESAIAMADGRVNGVGIKNLWVDGNPVLPPNFDARAWADSLREIAVASLHSWAPPAIGPAPNSGITGEQEDQTFKRAEPLLHERALLVTYLSALKYANRPCHHLEANGEQLNLAAHPECVLWSMRPDKRFGSDTLGKTGGFANWDVPGGWWGADEEHALFNTWAAATRLTGSHALQAEGSHLGRNFLLEHTVKPGLATSRPGPARAQGWTCILAVHLWRELEDRQLAELVRLRWLAWYDTYAFMLPRFDVRTDDPRLGPGRRYMPWQEAVKAYGLDLAGAVFNRPQARQIALTHALQLLDQTYLLEGMQWTTRDVVPLKADDAVDTEAVVTKGFYNFYGLPMAPATVLRNDPTHTKAQLIWDQLRAQSVMPKHTGWLAPGL